MLIDCELPRRWGTRGDKRSDDVHKHLARQDISSLEAKYTDHEIN